MCIRDRFERQVRDLVRTLFVREAVVRDDPATKRAAQLRGARADGPGADNAHRLAEEFAANQAVLGPALAAPPVGLRHVAQQREHHAQRPFRDGFIGVTAGIAHLDPARLGRLEIHVVHAGKGDVDVLQARACADHFATERHVGQHQDIGILGVPDLFLNVLRAFKRGKGMPHLAKRRHVALQHLGGNGKGCLLYTS